MGWKVEQGKEFIDFIQDYRTWLMWEAHTPVPKCKYLNHIKFFSSSRIFLPPKLQGQSLNLNNFPGPYVLPFNGRISLHLIKSRSFSLELNRCISIPRVNKVIKNGDYKDMTGMIKELSVLSQRFNDFFTHCQTAKLLVFFLKIGFA